MKKFRPAGQGKTMLLSARAESNQRIAGDAFDERLRAAGAHRRLAPDPVYGGRPPEDLAFASGGSEHKTLRSSCPGPLGPIWSEISKCLRCADTAYSGKAVAAGPPDHRRTQQEGMHQAVCVSVPMASNLDGSRPQWAGSRKAHGQILGPPKLTDQPKGPAPVNRGLGESRL